MNNNKCIYLKQKINGKLECKKQKKIINIRECNSCSKKEYMTSCHVSNGLCQKQEKMTALSNNHQIKKRIKPSKRTQALAINKQTKLIVWERDNHKCIFCGREVPWNLANSHFIKRSHGGLGIPENLFCNCLECHNKFDDSVNRKWMLPIARNYLISKYDGWNEKKLVYKKQKHYF